MLSDRLVDDLAVFEPFLAHGRVTAVNAGRIECDGPGLGLGAHCMVAAAGGQGPGAIRAQVVEISGRGLTLAPFENVRSISIGSRVTAVAGAQALPVGDALAGRAVDALGRPLDGGPIPRGAATRDALPAVLDRVSPREAVPTGISAIDSLLTLGRGCRMGILAASGVGKTTLVSQLLETVQVDRKVICLVGERGREVEAFWKEASRAGRAGSTTIVAATSDESAPMRAQAVDTALRICEHWRDRGEHVLLVVDSVTRYAMALREIGLLAGEPPTVRAYTPGVFRELPRIVERCGAARGRGAITALFTVLSEDDDADDPITEVMKSLLDGHIVLSRRLAQMGHFPAIDVGRSISRLFSEITTPAHRRAATDIRAMLTRYEDARLLIESGMYRSGSDAHLDRAIALHDPVMEYLRQEPPEAGAFPRIIEKLVSLAGAA